MVKASLLTFLFLFQLISLSASAQELCRDVFTDSAKGFPSEGTAPSDLQNAIHQTHERARRVEFDPDQLVQEYPNIKDTYLDALAMTPGYSTEKPYLSLVIPAYKEAHRLPESLVKIQRFFDKFPFPVEVLVMVEKSPDFTYEVSSSLVAGDPRIKVIDNVVKNGKGYAVRSGMKRSQGEITLFMDADLSTPLPEIFNFLQRFQREPQLQVLIGDRKTQADNSDQKRSLFRQALSKGFSYMVQKFSVEGIPDTQCGFKAFRKKANAEIFKHQSLNTFAFDVEVLVLAKELGYQIGSQPVKWIDDKRSTVHPLWDPLKMARDIVQIKHLVKKNLREAQKP
ncbi:glycosyltransferase [Bdellovibrio sp. HCB337]|uniref:glycosyltransferase n=1 Tax=Bdellovibrio sp. HCB337 TaxID=3394358 RepID=UPI0039A67814